MQIKILSFYLNISLSFYSVVQSSVINTSLYNRQ